MSEVLNVEKLFGENVFTLGKMQERLPKKAFAEVKRVMEHGGELDNATADVALEEGEEHFPKFVYAVRLCTHGFLTSIFSAKQKPRPQNLGAR